MIKHTPRGSRSVVDQQGILRAELLKRKRTATKQVQAWTEEQHNRRRGHGGEVQVRIWHGGLHDIQPRLFRRHPLSQVFDG